MSLLCVRRLLLRQDPIRIHSIIQKISWYERSFVEVKILQGIVSLVNYSIDWPIHFYLASSRESFLESTQLASSSSPIEEVIGHSSRYWFAIIILCDPSVHCLLIYFYSPLHASNLIDELASLHPSSAAGQQETSHVLTTCSPDSQISSASCSDVERPSSTSTQDEQTIILDFSNHSEY